MKRITRVLAVPTSGTYYYDDVSALRPGSSPATRRRGIVRGVVETISVGLVLDDQEIVWGDCAPMPPGSVRGGAGPFSLPQGLRAMRDVVAPALRGRALDAFRPLSAEVDALTEQVTVERPVEPPKADAPAEPEVADPSRRALLRSVARLLSPYPDDEAARLPTERVTVERRLDPAVRYGVSQALLAAVARARGVTMAEVIADEWGLRRPSVPVSLHARAGRDRYMGADKMIVRRVASLPHGPLVEAVADPWDGAVSELVSYVNWLRERIGELGGPGYTPTIHLDVEGALGAVFKDDLEGLLDQVYALERAARPYPLRIEGLVVMGSREAQVERLKALREHIGLRKMDVELVADEWANTLEDVRAFVAPQAVDMVHLKMPELGGVHNAVEAVQACKEGGVRALLGGSPAETDLSARVSVHVALAVHPDLLLAKPGLGVDEAIAITQNEMLRTVAWVSGRRRSEGGTARPLAG